MIVGKDAVLRGVLTAVGAAVAVLAWPSAAAAHTIDCRFSPGSHKLTVEIRGDDLESVLKLVRDGDVIRVRELGRGPVRCEGATPTVFNTDSVIIEEDRATFIGGVLIDLSGGPFAPGFSPEPSGESEIEFTARLNGVLSSIFIGGTAEPDRMRFGRIGSRMGANLNPSESQPDVDLTMRGLDFMAVVGFAGADRLSARGGPEFDGPFGDTRSGPSLLLLVGMRGDDVLIGGVGEQFLDGGPHRDRLVGGPETDLLLGGGARDRLIGGPGRDLGVGGKGRDRINLGRGRDRLQAVDGFRDRVNCGPGKDRGRADRKDLLRNCPRVKRVTRGGRRRSPPPPRMQLRRLPGSVDKWLPGVRAR